jgi:hypothetical protein
MIPELTAGLTKVFDRSEINYLRGRVIELERQLEAERTENRRTERWCLNMLMRRAATHPVPPQKAETQEPQPVKQVTDTDIAQFEAIRNEGLRSGAGPQEIADAVRIQTGWSEQDIVNAMRGS